MSNEEVWAKTSYFERFFAVNATAAEVIATAPKTIKTSVGTVNSGTVGVVDTDVVVTGEEDTIGFADEEAISESETT